MTAAEARPLPVPDDRSGPFWEAAAAHTLTVARCSECGSACLPPDVVCPACGSVAPDFRFVPVRGTGTLRSWTVVRQSFLPGFAADVPFVLVDVELDDAPQVRMIGRLLDGTAADLEVGAPLRVAWEDLADGVSVPAFRQVAD